MHSPSLLTEAQVDRALPAETLSPPAADSPPQNPPPCVPVEAARGGTVVAPANEPAAELAGERPAAAWGLTTWDQWVVAVCVLLTLGLLTVHWLRLSGWGSRPVEIERLEPATYEARLDVNRANWLEWMLVDGVGETLARRIVEDRERNGPFRSLDDLARVRGIGPRTVERMRPFLRITPPDEEAAAVPRIAPATALEGRRTITLPEEATRAAPALPDAAPAGNARRP